jgi:hypothetical protein
MTRRPAIVLCAAVLASSAAAIPAVGAASKPSPRCPMVTDPVHDYDGHLPAEVGATAYYDPTLDIVSANAWTDTRYLHTAIRVAHLPSAEDGTPIYGRQWTVKIDPPEGFPIYVSLMSRDGYDWTMAYTENEAPGTVYLSYAGVSHDYVRKTSTIRVHVPLSELANDVRVRPGVRWILDRAMAHRLQGNPSVEGPPVWLGPGGVGDQVDSADGNRAIVVGKPECRS